MEYLNLYDVFAAIEEQKYCIAKYRDLEEIFPGNDIDLFVFDINEISKKIINSVEKQIINDKHMKIHVMSQGKSKVYIDVLYHEKIYVRFDLCGEMPEYSRVNVKPGLFDVSVEKAEIIQVKNGTDTCRLKIMAKEQDLIIRYLEYVEWYERRPDKIKHLDYVLEKTGNDQERKIFLDDLHYYTGFPSVKYTIESGKAGPIENLKYIIEKCKGKSLGDLWAIFKQKVL